MHTESLNDASRVAKQVDDLGFQSATLQTFLDQANRIFTVLQVMLSSVGLLALLVACLGIFGVMAYQVSRRINEIGVRMALGASRGGILALILREVAVMLTMGCLIGGAAALMLTGLARKMLFGITPTEPGVFAVASLVLGLAALAAGWLPARRASRVDPMAALRHE